MRIRALVVLSVVAATLSLPAVSSGERRAASNEPVHRLLMRSSANSATLPSILTTQTFHNDMNVYGVTGAFTGARPDRVALTFEETITTGLFGPMGAATSALGHVFVTNSGAADIVVFSYTGSNFTITNTLMDPSQMPDDVDSSSDEKLVAVSNGLTSSSNGSVSLYANGATMPTSFLMTSVSASGVGIAIDGQQNCFWSYDDISSGTGSIVEFRKCKGAAVPLVTGLKKAGGVAVDHGNDLYYVDQGAGQVYRCVGILSCSVLAKGFVKPLFLHFDAGWKHLWLTDPGSALIYALNPKSGKVLSRTKAHGGTADPPFGIAADPSSKF